MRGLERKKMISQGFSFFKGVLQHSCATLRGREAYELFITTNYDYYMVSRSTNTTCASCCLFINGRNAEVEGYPFTRRKNEWIHWETFFLLSVNFIERLKCAIINRFNKRVYVQAYFFRATEFNWGIKNFEFTSVSRLSPEPVIRTTLCWKTEY